MKFDGDSLIDGMEQRMAVLRYGEGPGIVAMGATGRV
jgi:hypothetical protein